MAKIPLRAYTKEIDGLIDRGQYEQALAHCRYILKILPKHIDTYRLMAKAYLESQRYSDASDVFQRVLSSIPDDFVSQLGMSIIREDEGNLDAAIWHMERAFEVQPSNGAIQSELRRLYGRRDGYEPPKIRLTRGALARMYHKGELYPQAINELRAALAEDPQRLDLQLMLAKTYEKAGQRVEAANTCTAVLKKLPYCIEANRIQAEILVGMGREEDAKAYRQTAIALNPYLGQTSPRAPTPELVPDEAVVLEKLDWVPDRSVASQPRWAKSLGVDLGSQQEDKEDTPDWLKELENNVPPGQADAGEGSLKVSPFVSEEEQPESSGELIPEWMKDAGWEPSMGDTTPAEMGYTFDEGNGDEEGEELAPAEIPSWLRGMAPEEALAPDQPHYLDEEEVDQKLIDALDSAALPWLEESPPEPSDTIAGWLDGKESTQKPESEKSSSEGLPDWLVGAAAAGIGMAAASAAAGSDREQEPEDELPSEDEHAVEDSQAVIAEFDQDFAKDIDSGSDLGAPDWLSELETAGVQDDVPGSMDQAEEAGLPDWLVGAAAAYGASEILSADEQADEIDEAAGAPLPEQQDMEPLAVDEAADLPDWLAAPGVEDEFEAELGEELPDWLSEVQPSEGVLEALELTGDEDLPEQTSTAEVGETFQETPAAEMPELDVAEDLPGQVEPPLEETPQEPFEAEPEESGLPEWLVGAAAGAAIGAAALASTDDEPQEPTDLQPVEEAGEQPELLPEEQRPSAEVPAADLPEPEVSWQEEPAPEAEEIVTPEEEEAAFAWLEGLAAKQGASEALFLSPEERSDEPPDWVQMEAALAAGALALDGKEDLTAKAEEAVEEEGVIAEEPADLEALADDTAATAVLPPPDEPDETVQEPAPVEPTQEGLDELAARMAEGGVPAEATSLQEIPEDITPEEYLPDWLRAAGPESEVAQARAELDEDAEIHAWLSQVDQPVEMVGDAAGETETTEIDEEDVLDWLPDMAAEEADLDGVLAEESEDQILSGWLAGMPSEAAVQQSVDELGQAGLPEDLEIPDWVAGTVAAGFEAADRDQADITEQAVDPTVAELEESTIEDTLAGASAGVLEIGEPEITPEDTQPSAAAAEIEEEAVSAEGLVQELEVTDAEDEEPAGTTAAETEGTPLDDDAAFAWLESLAVKQGATEALLLDPEERREEPPEWVLEASLQGEGLVEQAESVYEQAAPRPGEDESAEEVELQEELQTSAEAHDDDLPDWLIGAGAAAGAAAAAMLADEQGEPESEAAAELEPETQAMDLPDVDSEIDELIPGEELPELPDWLADLEPQAGEEGEWVPEMADIASISKAIADEQEITPLDINKASLIELERLPGMGFRRAQAVIEYRQAHGAFESFDELEAIEGFDSELLEELAPFLQVAEPATAEAEIPEEMEVDLLIEARAAIYQDDIPAALENYQSLIQQRHSLPEIVKDLEEALYTHPVDASIWMALGDAQMRAGQLHQALESYNKAEELLV